VASLRRALGIHDVWLINDLVANAWGVDWLTESEVQLVYPGRPDPEGNRAVIAPGTGLGEAGMIWTGERYLPFASEGGHAEFGPSGPLEYELAEYLERRFGRVSYEHVLSGPGLVNLYVFLRDTARGTEPDWLAEEMQQEDPAACISRAAIAGTSPLCADALRIFLEIFGQESGNLALKLMATGGVWLGGGIVPKIVDWLVSTPHFLEGFTRKGKLSHVVEKIPVYAIANSSCALLGAARYASEQM
jgi:glucokinase